MAELFSKVPAAEIDRVTYLLQGRVAPFSEAVEFGMADKTVLRALSEAASLEPEFVLKMFRQVGDIGEAVYKLKNQDSKVKTKTQKLKVADVFEMLSRITHTSGEGAVEKKVGLLSSLLEETDSLSAKYIVRIILGKMRLGFSDMTMLDALSWSAAGDKSLRPKLEYAYSISADIGRIAKVFRERGVKGLEEIEPSIGTPIRTAQSERLPSPEEIIKKLGECAVEPKMDGFRAQLHCARISKVKSQNSKPQLKCQNFEINIYSRNLENTTLMFPDLVEALEKFIDQSREHIDNLILDSEAIAVDPKTGKLLPFQETMQRKRKYDISQKALSLPLKAFVFDLLYLNGKSLIREPFIKRRQALEKIFEGDKGDGLELTKQHLVGDVLGLRRIFDEAIRQGLEGVMCKKLDSVYQAGARNFNWVKFKKATEGELTDTIDAVVLGYNRGEGKRSAFGIGAFLAGVYDEKEDKFVTVAKIGTGLTDEQWRELKLRADKYKVKERPSLYLVDKNLAPEVWVAPKIVAIIRADEITKSPIHTAARGRGLFDQKNEAGAGLALRFPRLVDFREDKKPEEATTVGEMVKMYKLQNKS